MISQILMIGSRLWAKSRVWTAVSPAIAIDGYETNRTWMRSCSTVAAPAASTAISRSVKKRVIFKNISNLSEEEGKVANALELFKKEDENGFVKSDLIRWAKLLNKRGKINHAAEIFAWAHKQNMAFSPSEAALFVDLLLKTRGTDAAHKYYWNMPFKQRSDAAFKTLMEDFHRKLKEQRKLPPYRMFGDVPEFMRGPQPSPPVEPPPLAHNGETLNETLQKALDAYMDRIGFVGPKPLSKRMARKLEKQWDEMPCVPM